MSEFGRTARENGNRGTDHGHANVRTPDLGAILRAGEENNTSRKRGCGIGQ
ncbi:MAG: hypothetical protein WB368_05245 [Candidatus Sulfotelmatobacter sp.]